MIYISVIIESSKGCIKMARNELLNLYQVLLLAERHALEDGKLLGNASSIVYPYLVKSYPAIG